MRTIFIIHGSGGNPKENWFPWLKSELEKIGEHVIVPQFQIPNPPAPGGHKLSVWLKKMDEYKDHINSETIIVAHSRGCIFTYRFLENLTVPVSAVFLVAPWINFFWYPKGYTGIDSFHATPFNWQKIKSGSRYFEIYQSTNDDTPIAEGREIAEKLGGKLIIVKNAGHFNTTYDPKYKKFDLLLQNIKRVL